MIAHVIGGYGLPHNVFRQFTRAEQARLLAQLGAASNSILNAARERACGIGVATILLESRSGDVAVAIVDIALEKKVELIVVDKRGFGRIAGLLLGNISQQNVSLAPRLATAAS